jgi:hypothetical protein
MTSSKTVKVQDTTFAGKILHEIALSFDSEIVTVREIITARIHQEVAQYNSKLDGRFSGLVAPTDAESTLNGYVMKSRQKIDPEKQVYVALDAFQRNGYFVLIDNEQSESLDQQVLLTQDTVVSFIKLTPLVGG